MYKILIIAVVLLSPLGAKSNALAVPVIVHVVNRSGNAPLVSMSNHGPLVARNDAEDAGLIKIANNFTQYRNSPYWGWLGYSVFGPGQDAGRGTEWWLATAFTPKSNRLATRVEVAAEYDYGTNGAVLALYDDAGGLPGKPLRSWQLTNLPHAVCCTVAAGSDKRGVPLTGGKQYWVVIRTNAKDQNAVVVWALTEFADVQKHGSSFALYCSGSCGTWKNNAWNLQSPMLYGLAFAVLGK